jgi:hypothetical protein
MKRVLLMLILRIAGSWFALGLLGTVILVARKRAHFLSGRPSEIFQCVCIGIILGPLALYTVLAEKGDSEL